MRRAPIALLAAFALLTTMARVAAIEPRGGHGAWFESWGPIGGSAYGPTSLRSGLLRSAHAQPPEPNVRAQARRQAPSARAGVGARTDQRLAARLCRLGLAGDLPWTPQVDPPKHALGVAAVGPLASAACPIRTPRGPPLPQRSI